MFDKILGLFTSKVIPQVGDLLYKFIPTKEKRDEAQRELVSLMHNNEMEVQRFTLEAEQTFNQRVKDLEGTATDLKQFGWVGKTVIFLRGLQRPIWGFGTLYMDYMIFSKEWVIPNEDQQLKSAFWIINFLVLVFLFGERAVKNVGPLVIQMLNLGNKK